jgi:hypothetical protein
MSLGLNTGPDPRCGATPATTAGSRASRLAQR